MPLTAGAHLGSYEILAAIGAGGMGEVYRARDTRLNRDVALKILPAEVAADPSRRQRFEIEARAGRAYVSVTADDTDSLRLLASPETVGALQELTRIAVQTKTGAFSRLILDVAGSRDARAQELTQLVDRAIERIEGGASSSALPPMSSYERKLVHDIVAERGYGSESEGEGRDRHTVVTAK